MLNDLQNARGVANSFIVSTGTLIRYNCQTLDNIALIELEYQIVLSDISTKFPPRSGPDDKTPRSRTPICMI